jgi:hypothetical protein
LFCFVLFFALDEVPLVSFPNDLFILGLIPAGSTDAIVLRYEESTTSKQSSSKSKLLYFHCIFWIRQHNTTIAWPKLSTWIVYSDWYVLLQTYSTDLTWPVNDQNWELWSQLLLHKLFQLSFFSLMGFDFIPHPLSISSIISGEKIIQSDWIIFSPSVSRLLSFFVALAHTLLAQTHLSSPFSLLPSPI